MTPERLTLTRPDDWHLHLRDGDVLADTVAHTARSFARAIVMPNLRPPVTTVAAARAYRDRIHAVTPAGSGFTPLMTLYLTDTLDPNEIQRGQAEGVIQAVKYYPAGATTNSQNGVTAIERVYPALERLAALDMPLLIHGEVTDPAVDIFDREAVFIERVLMPLRRRLPELRLVLEHITTRDAVAFVQAQDQRVAATITPHHLLYNRNDMLVGGVRPHFYCLPVLKRDTHRQALRAAAVSGDPRFFLGTDSAPHARHTKETDCGCAGIFSAHAALELYAEVFAEMDQLARLEGFASFHGADFYRLPRNTDTVTLVRENWQVPNHYPFGADTLVPLRYGETVGWRQVALTEPGVRG